MLTSTERMRRYGLSMDKRKFSKVGELVAIGRHQLVINYCELYPKIRELFMAGKLSYRAVLAMANPKDPAVMDRKEDE